jgi:Hemerythrin HHE cation binding domain
MRGEIYRHLARDHQRLDDLLERAMSGQTIDAVAYHQFRAGLLKHISMEEKILLPAAQRLAGGKALAVAAKLRLDHGALAALLVPAPTAPLLAAIQTILKLHNPIEEDPGGMYEQCEELAGAESDKILRQLLEAPDVKLAPNFDSPHVLEVTRRALARAGYDLEV